MRGEQMEIGIIGLPRSGKTTLFNALTRGTAGVHAYSSGKAVPNVGVVKVPDQRLGQLASVFNPKRTVSVEITYLDAPAWTESRSGLGGELLVLLGRVNAFIHVVRMFDDASVPHPEGSLDPGRDVELMNTEMTFSDMGIVERRLLKVEELLKGARAMEKDRLLQEKDLLHRLQSSLEDGIPVGQQSLTDAETKLADGYQFLTAKPALLILNIGEEQVGHAVSLEQDFDSRYGVSEVAAVCAKLEMELAQLEEAEAAEFREAMGLGTAVIDRVIALSYRALGLVSFFTVVSGEVRAWTVRQGTTAQKAAGKVHSDMERGFIRAEVVSYDDLLSCGGTAEARKRGLLRVEGKDYVVRDGDIITFLFNV